MIRVDNISKSYRSGRGLVHALSGVSFSIAGGKTLTVAGKSGSGKTTLLSCIAGFERPDTGSISCFGTDIHRLTGKSVSLFQRRNMGFVFQHGNLLSYLTVSENISFPMVLNGIGEKEKKIRVSELLERIGLSDASSAMPCELSGGEMQRVAFARAIAHSPKILLADEPTASLDSETALRLIQLMLDMGRDQACVLIISTHDREIVKLSDKTVHLLDGKIT